MGQDIFLSEFQEAANEKLCVKRALEHYLVKTRPLVQKGEQHLFVSFGGKKPGLPVSKRTVSGWLVRAIKETYQLMGADIPSPIQAHSTRAMATSWAMFNGASIVKVMKAGDWRSSQTFARHYGLDLWKKSRWTVWSSGVTPGLSLEEGWFRFLIALLYGLPFYSGAINFELLPPTYRIYCS